MSGYPKTYHIFSTRGWKLHQFCAWHPPQSRRQTLNDIKWAAAEGALHSARFWLYVALLLFLGFIVSQDTGWMTSAMSRVSGLYFAVGSGELMGRTPPIDVDTYASHVAWSWLMNQPIPGPSSYSDLLVSIMLATPASMPIFVLGGAVLGAIYVLGRTAVFALAHRAHRSCQCHML